MDNEELMRRLARLLDAYDKLTKDDIKIPVDKRMQFFEDAAITIQVPVFDPATPEELAAFKVILLHASAITVDARADGNACISITIPDIYCSVQQPDNQ